RYHGRSCRHSRRLEFCPCAEALSAHGGTSGTLAHSPARLCTRESRAHGQEIIVAKGMILQRGSVACLSSLMSRRTPFSPHHGTAVTLSLRDVWRNWDSMCFPVIRTLLH